MSSRRPVLPTASEVQVMRKVVNDSRQHFVGIN